MDTTTLGDIVRLDLNNLNNYMFDTTAYNKVAEYKATDLPILKNSLKLGYRYYTTYLQYRELAGMRVNKTNDGYDDRSEKVGYKQNDFKEIQEELSIERLAHQASFYYRAWSLDGSCFLPIENSDEIKLFQSILNNNTNHFEDANIAASAMTWRCMLVTADGRQFKETKKLFPNNVILYSDLINKLTNGGK